MSDQDFFFDEEESAEEKPAKKSGSDSAKKTSSAKKSGPDSAKKDTRDSSGSSGTPFLEQNVTMTIAILMAVVALLIGVIGGILIPTDSNVPAPTATGTGGASAPQLSPEQLESGMPEGHPDVGGAPPAGETPPEGSETTEGAE